MSCKTILDFGCGKGKLADKLIELEFNCYKYDPAIKEYENINHSEYDLVIANDVLEHLDRRTMHDDIERIKELASICIFLNVSCRPATYKLPDGRNCHTVIESPNYWRQLLLKSFDGFKLISEEFNESNKNLILIFVKK